jgi:hypothetical protein|nr:MAG TPA: hypothetical protein [Caudoviricetes sp.]
MQDRLQPSRVDFGNFQLSYEISESSSFYDIEYIDENYVATLLFEAPGTSVSVVATDTQLEVWRDYFELSVADRGVYMKTLPIMCPRKENMYLFVRTYDGKLFFSSGTMYISISLADCLKDFASYIDEIYCNLGEKEEGEW